MYHYTECGLRNIYLKNGYHQHDTAYGKALSIDDMQGLHNAIACDLINYKPKLTGSEFRFLRNELLMSQKRLADLLGTSDQTLSLWERKGNLPKWADRMIRLVYLDYFNKTPAIVRMVDQLNNLDRHEYQKARTFSDTEAGWKADLAA
jgi:DNA-binding transcriptional regulator YiaG